MSDLPSRFQDNEPTPSGGQDGGFIEPPPMTPEMAQFRDLNWTPNAKDWANEVAVRVNDQQQRERIADANAQAGQNYVNNLDQFRQGLVDWTTANPQRADAAISLVRPSIDALIAHGNHPDDERQGHFEALSSDIEGQIAHAAVQRLAEIHGPSAQSELDRLGNYLDDDQKSYLGAYITAQDFARGTDAAAQQQMASRAAAQQSAVSMLGHAASLYDPRSDQVAFPPGWAQRLTADDNVAPADKGALMHLYGRLQSGGDAPVSDPYLVSNMLRTIGQGGALDHGELIGNAGARLRVSDMLHLAPGTGNLSPDQRNYYGQLADTADRARTALMGPDGENGVAGSRAWGRYINWMMEATRQGSVTTADPDAHPLNAVPAFRPSGDDLIEPPPATRPSLKEIFGR